MQHLKEVTETYSQKDSSPQRGGGDGAGGRTRRGYTMGARTKHPSEIGAAGAAPGPGEYYDEERDGMRCLGSAVFNEKKQPVAAIWLTGPSSRLPQRDFNKLGALTQKAAEKISKRLGA